MEPKSTKPARSTLAVSFAHIATEYEVLLPDSACVYCSNCIGVCPTGALMFKSEYDMRQAGTWHENRQTQTDTICPYCGVGCDLTVHQQDRQIVRVTSPLDHSVTHGNLCIGALRLAVSADSASGHARKIMLLQCDPARREIGMPGINRIRRTARPAAS
jgi:predicted molibdopterin-dependent oxidoreductase YjgC